MLRHWLGLIPRVVWKIFFLLNFLLGLILLYPIFLVLLSRRQWYGAAFGLMRFWAGWVLTVPGIFLSVKRSSVKLPEGPCVYVANHCSYLDIVASYRVISRYFVYMGKMEIDKAPLLRIFFRDMNIYVNRKSRTGSYQAFALAGEKLRNGASVFIYPEGTIESRGQLLPFKNGAFRLAIENQVPIVPITYCNNWKLLQNGGLFKSFGRPGVSRIVVHDPIDTKGMTEEDLINLRHNVRSLIAQTLKEDHENRRKHR